MNIVSLFLTGAPAPKIDKEKHHALSAPIKKWIEFVEEYTAKE